MKKKSIGLVIIILIILIILVGCFTYAYAFTDAFKSNKQLFFKYLGQTLDEENGLFNSKIENYLDKKSNGKYENEGEIKVNVSDLEGVEQSVMDNVNNMNIKYSGKKDNTNQNIEGNITVNYNDDVNFPVSYKYVNDTLGIQTDYISKKYIGIENKNLKEFAEKFGITDVENVPDKIELDKSTTDKLTADEKKQLNDKYVEIVKEIADKKEFSKTQENGMDKLSVNITNQEIKDLMIKLLETLKDDKDVMSKLDSIYNEYGGVLKKAENLAQDSVGSEESTSSTKDNSLETDIQSLIDELNKAEIQDGTSEIAVYKIGKVFSGLSLKMDNDEVKLLKENTQDSIKYTLNIVSDDSVEGLSIEKGEMNLVVNYKNIQQSTVNEEVTADVIDKSDDKEQKISYSLNTTNKFSDDISIDDFKDDEIQKLNEQDGSYIANLLIKVIQRIQDVNTEQMDKIGFKGTTNPLLYTNPITLNIIDNGLITTNDDESESDTETVGTGISEDKEAAITDIGEAYTAYMENKYSSSDSSTDVGSFNDWMKENGEEYMNDSAHYTYSMEDGTVETKNTNKNGKTEIAEINTTGGLGSWTESE